jgi:hypothetical protein
MTQVREMTSKQEIHALLDRMAGTEAKRSLFLCTSNRTSHFQVIEEEEWEMKRMTLLTLNSGTRIAHMNELALIVACSVRQQVFLSFFLMSQ